MNTITNISQDISTNCNFCAINVNSGLICQHTLSKTANSSTDVQAQINNSNIEKLHLIAPKLNSAGSYRKSYITWDNIERANKPQNYTDKTKHLSKNSQALLAVIVQKLRNKDKLFLNHKYISKITRCERRQNQNIIKELSDILNINYHNSVSDNGKKYRYCYEFALKKLEQDKPLDSNDLDDSIEQKISRHSIYKENKIINNRSNKSNFYKFNSGSNSNNTDQPKYSEATRNTKTTKNGFLGSGKRLNEMLEHLTDEVCNTLRASSGKNFTDRAIKEIAKAVSRSKKGAKAFFYHINGFIAYLSKILRFEKRDPVKISSINYYITANLTEEERSIQEQEKYLSEIESSLQISPEWHLKKKLAAVLRRDIAYKILLNYQRSEKTGRIFKIYLKEQVAIREMDRQIILNQVKATQERVGGNGNIESIEEIEFIFQEKREQKSEKGESEKLAEIESREEIKKLRIWLQIRKYFMDYSFDIAAGIGLDKSWLSKLTACEDNNKISDNIKTLTLKAESKFIRDWINSNYLFKLESIAKELGYELLIESGY